MNYMSIITNLLAYDTSKYGYTVMTIVSRILMVLMLVAAVAAIILVMLQPGNSQGIDALGGSSETFFGKNKGQSTEAKLKKWTTICLIVLAVLAIVYFVLRTPQIWGIWIPNNSN